MGHHASTVRASACLNTVGDTRIHRFHLILYRQADLPYSTVQLVPRRYVQAGIGIGTSVTDPTRIQTTRDT